MVVVELIYNLSTLVAFSVFSGFIDQRFSRKQLAGKIYQGLLFGLVAIIGMLYPFILKEGVIFDGRSIVISLCTFFFGPISGAISAGMAALFRLWLGGNGMYVGFFVSITAFIVGYIFFLNRDSSVFLKREKLTLLVMGVFVHIPMMILLMAVPGIPAMQMLYSLGITVVGIYPIVTVLIGQILIDQRQSQTSLEDIRKSEQVLRSTLYSIGGGIITTNNDFIIQHSNRIAEKLTGWTESDAIGKELSSVLIVDSEESNKSSFNTLVECIRLGKVFEYPSRSILISRHGVKYPVTITAAPVINERGRVSGSVIIFKDQTAERISQNILRESERQLSALMGNLPGMVFRARMLPDRQMIFVSEGSRQLTGYSPEYFLTEKKSVHADLINPAFRLEVEKEIAQALSRKERYQVIYKITTADGCEKWAWEHGVGVFDSTDTLLFLEGFITDISERKSAEEKLKNSDRIFNLSVDMLFIAGSNGYFKVLNPSWERTFGWSHTELTSKPWYEFIHPEDRAETDKIRETISKKEDVSRFECRFQCKDGSWKWITLSISLPHDEENIYGVATDSTQRKKNEEMLSFYNDRLKLISSVAEKLIGKTPIEQMVHEMLKDIIAAFSVHAGVVRILTDKGFKLLTSQNIPEGTLQEYFPIDVGFGAEMLKNRKPIAKSVVPQDESTLKIFSQVSRHFRFASFAGSPLLVQEKFIGVIGLYSVDVEREFSEEDLNHLQISANHIALAIENSNLFTEIVNRKTELENEISRRKMTEDSLRESESKLNLIIETTNIVFYRLIFASLKYDYIHPAIEQITGYTAEEINQIGFNKIVLQIESLEGRSLNTVKISNDRSTRKENFRADYLIRKKDGETRWLSDFAFPWLNSEGKIVGSMGVLTDITDRKNGERQVSEQRNMFEQLFENSPVAIALLNNDINIITVNNAFSALFGYEKSEITGKNIDLLLASEERLEEAKNISYLTRFSNPGTYETFRRKKDGGEVFVKIAGVPVTVEGSTIAIYGMYVDLTERKNAEEEIRKAKDAAVEISKLKSNFLANMSHEIRTPLIGILGYSEILQEETEDESTRQMAKFINSSGTRLLETLNLILDWSRIESGRFEVVKAKVNIAESVNNVILLFTPVAAKKGLYIRADYGPGNMELFTDQKILSQIFNNLINNAVKFTDQGGITIQVRNENNQQLVITVRDTGIGISENDQRQIWEEFRQASEGYGRTHEGTGLGLSLTKKFVGKLGGTIEVESTPGKGSSFIIEFPLTPLE